MKRKIRTTATVTKKKHENILRKIPIKLITYQTKNQKRAKEREREWKWDRASGKEEEITYKEFCLENKSYTKRISMRLENNFWLGKHLQKKTQRSGNSLQRRKM